MALNGKHKLAVERYQEVLIVGIHNCDYPVCIHVAVLTIAITQHLCPFTFLHPSKPLVHTSTPNSRIITQHALGHPASPIATDQSV
jgi:hypothetical protein